MQLNDYQNEAIKTAVDGEYDEIMYRAIGLGGESGECLNQVKKIFRDDYGRLTRDRQDKLRSELGDVMWYIAALAHSLDLTLEEIALDNLVKIVRRREENTLSGSGDR